MSSIYSLKDKTLQEVIIKYISLKTEDEIYSYQDLPPEIVSTIEELTELLNRYYGNDNLYDSF